MYNARTNQHIDHYTIEEYREKVHPDFWERCKPWADFLYGGYRFRVIPYQSGGMVVQTYDLPDVQYPRVVAIVHA